jgi:hypothetical protein
MQVLTYIHIVVALVVIQYSLLGRYRSCLQILNIQRHERTKTSLFIVVY